MLLANHQPVFTEETVMPDKWIRIPKTLRDALKARKRGQVTYAEMIARRFRL